MKAWHASSDRRIAKVAEGFNGPLAELLVTASDHWDKAVVEIFRKGTFNIADLK